MTFLQIAPVSRGDVAEYRSLRRELEQLSGHINGAHAQPDWPPMRYVNSNFAHPTLTGFYRLAKIGLVTQIGRASGRERVCQYDTISVVAVSFKQKQNEERNPRHNNT